MLTIFLSLRLLREHRKKISKEIIQHAGALLFSGGLWLCTFL